MTGAGYRMLASADFGELVLGCVNADFLRPNTHFRHFRDQILEDLPTFAPLQTQNIQKISSTFFGILCEILRFCCGCIIRPFFDDFDVFLH